MPDETPAGLHFERLYGLDLVPRLQVLAELRIKIFRDWPYLYQGSHEAEAQYLQMYVDCPDSFVLLVWDGTSCIGASTSLPLLAAVEALRQPFIDSGKDLSRISYFGDLILVPAYRGHGLGLSFFTEHESHARRLGLDICSFCTVQRADDDARKPSDAVDLASFWQRRQYHRQEDLFCHFPWLDVDETLATMKRMNFWLRQLPPE
jgi:GNAT superfamily N-acetyltransferase